MSSNLRYTPVNLFSTCNTPDGGYDSKKCPIILIHGFFSTNRTWNFVKYKIAAKTKRKVYSLDMRNHGQSEYSEFLTLRDVVADIENFMKSHNIPKAIFIGHSMGSRPVMALALEKPELVEKIIVEDMNVTDPTDYPKIIKPLKLLITVVDKYIRNASPETTEVDLHKMTLSVMKNFYPEMNSTEKVMTFPFKKDKSGKLAWDLNIDAVLHYFDNVHLFHINLEDDPKYLGESLFLFGNKSPIKMEENETLKYFPNAQFYVFKGGFHTFHIEFTELFSEVVSKFIEE